MPSPCVRFLSCLSLTLSAGLSACQTGYEFQRLPILGLEHAGEAVERNERLELTLLPHEEEEGALVTRVAMMNLGSSSLNVVAVRVEGAAAEVLSVHLDEGKPFLLPEDPARWLTLRRVSAREGREPHKGFLVIETNETMGGAHVRRVPLLLKYPQGHLMASPASLAFGAVSVGTRVSRTLNLMNPGKAPLSLVGLTLEGAHSFSVSDAEHSLIDPADAGRARLDPPMRLSPGETRPLKVSYTALSAEVAKSVLGFTLEGEGRTTLVPFSANADLPCMSVNPSVVAFGGKVPGTTGRIDVSVRACSQEALQITQAEIFGDPSSAFALENISRDGDLVSLPMRLNINESVIFTLRFTPPSLSPLSEDGTRIPFDAALRLTSNAAPAQHDVPLSGQGVEVECPSAVIAIAEGSEVTPQTLLHLDGSQSYGAAPIVDYIWTVEQPPGSVGHFIPSASAPSPTFSADVAGVYTFYLKVRDANGASCGPRASQVVSVIPDEALHIELLWTTPAVDSGTRGWDSAGADLDLHLVHPDAAGIDLQGDGQRDGYFDAHFDCFWSNTNPTWEGGDADPRLDRDDTDGDGPENMNVDKPVDGNTYKVGVHYWADYDLGPSMATIRVYLYGNLVYERAKVHMVQGDLWDALTITWPSGVISAKHDDAGEPLIFPMVASDEFPMP